MYSLEIKPEADKIFRKLSKRNLNQLRMIHKKIEQIRKNPSHGLKHLKKPLQAFYRAHIDKHFVLIYTLDFRKEVVTIYYFDHHDNVYKWREK